MKTILLVEDEVIIARSHSIALQNSGYEVTHSITGEDAVAQAEAKQIDLILMDINLGCGINGLQAAKEILKNKSIPIIFLSANTQPEIRAQAEAIGCYLQKPISKLQLIDLVGTGIGSFAPDRDDGFSIN